MSAERSKLEEARYFLEQMEKPEIQADVKVFGFNFSAFLSAARSVLQQLREKAKLAKRQAWFDAGHGGSGWFGAFKDLRDVNIHWQDMKPGRTSTVIHQDGFESVGGGPVRPAKWRYATSCPQQSGFHPIYLDTLKHVGGDGRLHLIGHCYKALVFTDDDTSAKSFGVRRLEGNEWVIDCKEGRCEEKDLLDCCSAYLNKIEQVIASAAEEGSSPQRSRRKVRRPIPLKRSFRAEKVCSMRSSV